MAASLTLLLHAAIFRDIFVGRLRLIPERAAARLIARCGKQPSRLLQERWHAPLHDAIGHASVSIRKNIVAQR
jgi:hypothetical protein